MLTGKNPVYLSVLRSSFTYKKLHRVFILTPLTFFDKAYS